MKRRSSTPTTKVRRAVAYLEPRTGKQHEAKRRALDAIALKRRHPELSLTQAARGSGTTVKTIRRYAPAALETRSGRLDVKRSDRIPRDLRFLTAKGQVTVRVTNSRDASRVAKYNNAVRRFAMTLDGSQLKQFEGKALKAGSERYEFVTDPAALARLARAGEIHFLDIYAAVGVAA